MTWSIIARDEATGRVGIIVATRFFAVGALVPHIKTGVGAVATQAFVNPLYGPRGLGKTFVALGIAWAAASGASFLNWTASRPRRVLYIDGEMAAVDIRERLRLLGAPISAHVL